ncbi:hypothetical protein BGZ94_006992 [Podila epigama]|nr:hypothetical protein BGZ94_006992 [Podila epigama]
MHLTRILTCRTFTAPWEKLSAEATELATLHGQFSLRISNEIEKPLRDFSRTHPEWQNLALAEANCNRIAKEFEEKQAKVTKYTRTVERVSGKKAEAAEQKLMDYTKQLESTRSAWRLEGPVILKKYHEVDHARLEHLKQMVNAFEAMQTEIVLQIAEMSGRTLSSVAEFDPVLDAELFSLDSAGNLRSMEPRDGGSILSSNSHQINGDSIPNLDARRSHNDGSHKRSMTANSHLSNVSYSTEHSLTPSKTGSVDVAKAPEPTESHRAGSSVLGSSQDMPTSQVDAEGFTIPPQDNSLWSDAGTSNYDDERSETSSFSQAPKMHLEIRQDSVSESNDEARAALERVSSTLKQTKTISRRHPGRREVRSMYHSEDSSSAYNSYHSSPLSSAAFTPDSSRDPSSSSTHSPGPRVIFNTSAPHLQTTGAPFSPSHPRANTLGLPSSSGPQHPLPHSSHSIPPAPALSLLSTGQAQSPSVLGDGRLLSAEPESLVASGFSAPTSPTSQTDGYVVPAEAALSSSTDLLGSPSQVAEIHRSWVVSVIEKVHAHAQGGEISKVMVTGEVSLTLENSKKEKGAEDKDTHEERDVPPKSALLRLGHLQNLEKYVPNFAYLANVEGDESSFWVDLESLSRAIQEAKMDMGTLGHGIVVLKYQVRTPSEDAKTMCPLLIQPAWKCEPHQTSLLINYKANAHCRLSVVGGEDGNEPYHEQRQLVDLSFLVPISGAVVGVQSRPTGIWNNESNKMFWDVDPVSLGPTQEPHKLLARFEMNPAAGPSQASATAARFRLQGSLLSDLAVSLVAVQQKDEAGDEESKNGECEEPLGSVRLQVQSGRYLATV